MNIETKEFWEKVKEEYKPLSSFYICHYSETFCKIWNDFTEPRQDKKIVAHANVFLKTKGYDIRCTVSALFTTPDIEIRKEFIDYMINKFS